MTHLLTILDNDQRIALFSHSTVVNLKAGSTLFSYGDDANSFYFVEKGQIKLMRFMSSGEEKVFKVFTSGNVFAEMAMFLPEQRYPMTAVAEQDSVLKRFDRSCLFNLLAQHPVLSIKMMQFMGQRIGQLMDTIDTLTQINAEQKLVMFFAQLHKQQNRSDHQIIIPVTKKVLAHQLGIKPETLSRMYRKFKDKMLIDEQGAHIKLLDIKKLCQNANVIPEPFRNYVLLN